MVESAVARAAAVAVLSLVLGAAPASGHTATVSTGHALTLTPSGLAGQLTTTSECARDRSITLYRVEGSAEIAFASVGSTQSGSWTHESGGPRSWPRLRNATASGTSGWM